MVSGFRVAGCSRDRPGDRPSSTEITSGRLAAPPAGVDDTKQSERDKSGASLMTPMDQSNDPGDVALVQEIRKAVVADDTLSTTAKNVRIITSEGHVITIEPGIYIPEEGIGVRIEDTLLITATGAKVLSGALPRDPDVIQKFLTAGK